MSEEFKSVLFPKIKIHSSPPKVAKSKLHHKPLDEEEREVSINELNSNNYPYAPIFRAREVNPVPRVDPNEEF